MKAKPLSINRVLWITPPGLGTGLFRMLESYIKKVGINPNKIQFAQLTEKSCWRKRTKTIWEADKSYTPKFYSKLSNYDYDMIVVNDKSSLFYLTNKYSSLAQCRGGIYKLNDTIPILVIDDLFKTKSTRTGTWILLQDLKKLKRWITGQLKQEPAFNYKVCHSIDDVQELFFTIQKSILASVDIETTGTTISCIGYSCWTMDDRIKTFVVPFVNPTKPNNAHWETEDEEIYVWKLIQKINASETYKTMQNGSYDATYFTVYPIPIRNYLFDTLHLFHSVWAEAPKKLDFITSIASDFYTYWKDMAKDANKDDTTEDKQKYAVPNNIEGLEKYWLYNALDDHATVVSCKYLMAVLHKMPWARRNYVDEFFRQMGPAFYMSMRGIKVNTKIHAKQMSDLTKEAEQELANLRTIVDDENFNPKSTAHVSELIYDILRATPIPRKGRATDEVTLKMITTQDRLLHIIINQIWKAKKPAKTVSDYGDKQKIMRKGRFYYKLSAATTPTERYSSKGHDLWVGKNIQNVPKASRIMFEADPGHLLVEVDYEQSDAYFTAFESGDKSYIETMRSGKDTHCIHGAMFFKVDYDKLYAAAQKDEDWATHPTKGIRQITKRAVYGGNYFMAAFTLLMQMGKESVIAAAEHLGFSKAYTWNFKQLIAFCDRYLLEPYYERYPGIKRSIKNRAKIAVRNGNKDQTAFGYTRIFFGDIVDDDKAQREYAAFFGQGGTAGNINKSIRTIYYSELLNDVHLRFQVHDSIVFQIPETRLDLIPAVIEAMENEVTVRKETFVVPAGAKVGRGWGKRMIDFKPQTTLNDIDSHENAWQQKYWMPSN